MGNVILNVQTINGDPVYDFKYLVNENNVGDPWDPILSPSLKPGDSHSPVVATGNGEPAGTTLIPLPAGKYLVSVLAPGYKMGGNWVTLDPDANENIPDKTLEVKLLPNPLPLSKIRIHVFNDNNPVNGEDDIPLESGLGGFLIVLEDTVGEVTVDYFGNPLGTRYQRDPDGNLILDPLTGKTIPVPGTGGKICTGDNGDALIENLPPGKYGVQAIPPDGTDWVQTTTIEGTHIIDAWIVEGNDGYSPREGFKMPLVWIGFVKPMGFGPPIPWETGTIKGRIRTVIEFTPPFRPLTLGDPVDRPWIALSDIGSNDQQVYTGRGDSNGNFLIENVPAGIYQVAIWDEPLDHIISFRTVQVAQGENVDLGEIGIPRWYGFIKGKVFTDLNGDGVTDLNEMGIPDVAVGTRFKDGSMQYNTVTDMRGNYQLNEVFELERFAVAEVGFTRFARIWALATPDDGLTVSYPTGCTDSKGNNIRCTEKYEGALTLATLNWAAKTNKIDWGKRPYASGENGGISGIVYYATMRNETDPRYEMAEDYEPGIPRVIINLYATSVDQYGILIQGAQINSVETDAWAHPSGCPDHNGNPGACLEVPNMSNQIKPGVFDGGYAFENYWSPYYGAEGAVELPLPAGTYIVEVVPPPGYLALDEHGSTNTGEGDVFYSPPTSIDMALASLAKKKNLGNTLDEKKELARLAPPDYLPQPAPPFIDIHKKVVKVWDGLNATADFFLFTEVPVPGRIVGFLLDDLNLETDPGFIYYGEKRGIPHSPVGIRDYTGRLLTTVHSDKNGVFEVLLPSTYTRNIPTPSGVAPGMYLVIGNDPGDPDNRNPNYNPNYQTLILTFDVWPGKTTYADMALFPITAFVGIQGGAQFSQPPECRVTANTPQIFTLNKVEVNVDAVHIDERTLVIHGTGFNQEPGTVNLDDQVIPIQSWSNELITAMVPEGFAASGPAQLLVKNTTGKTGVSGITIHLRKTGQYWPDIISVPVDYPTIQAAIDAADGENKTTIIVVQPGEYFESPILYKKNVKLQGMGPGGIQPGDSPVTIPGSVIDGRFFLSYQDRWLNTLQSIAFLGPQEISSGQAVTVVAQAGQFSSTFRPQIDGFRITGARGDEAGGIYLNAYCNHLIISNNLIQGNGGGFGGGITIGKAYLGDCNNDNMYIHHNRILNNGGISLAGGIGIFNGAENYEISYNEICGNYSGEYGGGISHFGKSPGGKIHHNCISYNASFDEGAGIFIGGEQPIPPQTLTAGSGEVDIYNNLIMYNVANDDGGGIRLLQPLDFLINIYNNIIVNNVSTDTGGGIALDDASNVVIANNTVANNITTATAEDSDGLPHAAGLASELNSAAFQAYLEVSFPGSPLFSDPVLFNNIFRENKAGFFDQSLNGGRGGIGGIGAAGDPHPINYIDLEVAGSTARLNPEYCDLNQSYAGGSNNLFLNPDFLNAVNTEVTAVAFNMEPDFKIVKLITVVPGVIGNYHISGTSPVIDRGTASVSRGGKTYHAPATDFDDNLRPIGEGYDIGAVEAPGQP